MSNAFTYRQVEVAPRGMSKWIETRLVNHGMWVYNKHTSDVDDMSMDHNDNNIKETHQFTNTFFSMDTGPEHNLFSDIAQPLLWMLEKETGLLVTQIIRIKANLLNSAPGIEENHYHIPHIDFGGKGCVSMVYYVNDSDGDTRIFDKYSADGCKDLTMIHSNTPKQGNAILFESDRFHSSSNPIRNNVRCIINFVMEVEPNSLERFLKESE